MTRPPAAGPGAPGDRDVLFEFQRFGRSVRVCAIDPATNTEVVVVGTAQAGEAALKAAALRKLRYVLSRGETS